MTVTISAVADAAFEAQAQAFATLKDEYGVALSKAQTQREKDAIKAMYDLGRSAARAIYLHTIETEGGTILAESMLRTPTVSLLGV